MYYHNITHYDTLNGDGVRTVLWVSGCQHACKQCHNPQTWALKSGVLFDEEAQEELLNTLTDPYITGITFSGGDPLHPLNRGKVFDLCRLIKRTYPEKTIWLYTGYTFEEVEAEYYVILYYLDVLVDGRFELSEMDINLKWRGSKNQRVIDIPQTLKQRKIVLHCD